MSGFENDFAKKLRTKAQFQGKGKFPGILYRVSWYPGAIYLPNVNSFVCGEIFKLYDDPSLIQELDDYEDLSEDESISLYIRKKIPVMMFDGHVLDCWTYLYNQSVEGIDIIPHGDFYQFKST